MATYSTWRLRTFASITVVIQVKLSRNVLVQTFSFANDRTLFQNALSTLLTSLGVSQGQQAPGSQAKSLKLCLCLSPLSLFSLCFCDTFMVRQPLYTWWQDGCLKPSAHILPDKNPQEKPSFLVFFFSKNPEPSLRLSLSCFPVPEAIMAAKQVVCSDWSSRVVFPTLVLWELRVDVQNKIRVRFPQKQGTDAGRTERRKWSTNACFSVEEPWKHDDSGKRPHLVWFHLYEISRLGKSMDGWPGSGGKGNKK